MISFKVSPTGIKWFFRMGRTEEIWPDNDHTVSALNGKVPKKTKYAVQMLIYRYSVKNNIQTQTIIWT